MSTSQNPEIPSGDPPRSDSDLGSMDELINDYKTTENSSDETNKIVDQVERALESNAGEGTSSQQNSEPGGDVEQNTEANEEGGDGEKSDSDNEDSSNVVLDEHEIMRYSIGGRCSVKILDLAGVTKKSKATGRAQKTEKWVDEISSAYDPKEDLADLQAEIGKFLPEGYSLVIPTSSQRVNQPPEGCQAFYAKQFAYGLRIPFAPLLEQVLDAFTLAPAQILPNSIGYLIAFSVLMKAKDKTANFRHFWQFFKISTSSASNAGSVYFSQRSNHSVLSTIVSSNSLDWKRRFFFIKGPEEPASEGSSEMVPHRWSGQRDWVYGKRELLGQFKKGIQDDLVEAMRSDPYQSAFLVLEPVLRKAELSQATYRLVDANDPRSLSKDDKLFRESIIGCDGSVLIDSTTNNTAEKDAIPNRSLSGFDVIDEIKTQLENTCPGIVSCADILALATRDSISFQFNRSMWEVLTGRRDGIISKASEALANIPSPFANFTNLRQSFADKSLTVKDLVVLSGAHTIGVGHCNLFSNRLYNFTGKGDSDPSLNTTYATTLRSQCRSLSDNTTAVEMDPGSSLTFDNHYFSSLKQQRGLFQSDSTLMSNKIASGIVEELTSSSSKFFTEFSQSMKSMGAIDVLTGNAGEIRKKCSVVN
ncbi:hypothetical protein RD792_017209 [Penstemon davidsonii]|uniref:peroxidase n=1 Tax=Penstemon davidsonii TaxID=160366 RepID=A0ABR0CMB6_9LAMI|nr:hypothetical protein RD792_017209 [Penstemon davidsonii]